MKKLSPIHPFPARMASSIAWRNIPEGAKQLRVLDPMAGSGTTLVVARAKGHKAIGFDRDPLAVLIAQAWCSQVNKNAARFAAEKVCNRAKSVWRRVPLSDAYPIGADKETQGFVRFWFDQTNRRQLAALSKAISRLRDQRSRLILWCALSKLIVTKKIGVSLAMDVSHSRPHRSYKKAPIRPLDKFVSTVEAILKLTPFEKGVALPSIRIKEADARRLPVQANTIDLVVTSPPYLNAIDYLRGHKLSLVWMAYKVSELREVRATNIGAEVSKSLKQENLLMDKVLRQTADVSSLTGRVKGWLTSYIHDMDAVLSEISRVLVPKGRAVFVVGDSTVYGTYIRNSRAIARLAEIHGLKVISKRIRPLPANRRYLPPPTLSSSGAQFQSRMRKEVVICMRKIA